MSRGRLVPPNLDDRMWQDIVNETVALIPTYAKEWTDHNLSDLGITLVELFAWLVEGMIYRLNRVADRQFIEFLKLIGVTRDPATPASAYLTYRLSPMSPALIVPKGNQVSTQQTESDEAIIFETNEDLTVLPINLTTALLIQKVILNKYSNVSTNIVDSPLSGMSFTIPSGQATMIALGFDEASTDAISLLVDLSKRAQEGDLQVQWRYSQGTAEPSSWPLLLTVDDTTGHFQKNGVVELGVPGDWTAQNPQDWTTIFADSLADEVDQSRFWIGIQISNLLVESIELGVNHILFNSVQATNAVTIPSAEPLGTSDGSKFQAFELQNQPLFKQPGAMNPYGHLHLQVREPALGGGFDPWTDWEHVEEFPEGSGNQYRLDPVTGTVEFGNHDPSTSPDGHGRIPPADSEIQAATYRYVAGDANGNLPSGVINVIRAPLPGLVAATNKGFATGGSDEEDVEETKRRGPEVLRNRFRAVTAEDYEYLAREATTDIEKVRCLPPRMFTTYDTLPVGINVGDPWTYGSLNRDAGNVNVIVIPLAPLSNPSPMPSEELLQEVTDYLQERRVVTNLLRVTYPRYLPIEVTIDLKVWQKALDTGLVESVAQVQNDIEDKIAKFLHPTLGGPEGTGWEVGQDIMISSIFDYLQPDLDVGFISDLSIQAGAPLYLPADRPYPIAIPSVWVQLADYEIVCGGTPTVLVSAI